MRIITLTVLLMVFTSCKSIYYHQRLPVIEKPVKPKLENIPGSEMEKLSPEARKSITGNFNKLIDYSKKLEAGIDTYNEYAKKQNDQIGKKEKKED